MLANKFKFMIISQYLKTSHLNICVVHGRVRELLLIRNECASSTDRCSWAFLAISPPTQPPSKLIRPWERHGHNS